MAAASQKRRIFLAAFKLETATIRIRNSCTLKVKVSILQPPAHCSLEEQDAHIFFVAF